MNKRNRRKRGGISPLSLLGLVVVLAIGCGYLCSHFLVLPLLTGTSALETPPAEEVPSPDSSGEGASDFTETDPQDSGADESNELEKEVTKEPETEPDAEAEEPKNGTRFVIQYGAFSTAEGAEERKKELTSLGIETVLLERNGAFKLYGDPCLSESAARLFLEERRATAGGDIFITEVEANLL